MNKDWMIPKDYFERIVKPTIEEYRADKKDHHKECAIFQLSSFSERYFGYHKENSNIEQLFGVERAKDFRDQITQRCPEYRLLWDAANAAKHQFPTGIILPGTLVTTSTEIWDSGKYEVCGRLVTIEQAIDIVYEFWRRLLDAESK